MTILKKIKKLLNTNKYASSTVVYSNSTAKYSMNASCTMEFSSKTEEKRKEMEAYLKQIIKKHIDEPEKLIRYMKMKGVEIYRLNNAAGILANFGEEEGFISALSGIKALILNIILSVFSDKKFKIAFSTAEMLIIDKKKCDIYIIARALHKYYGLKNNLPGFDKHSQDIFKKLYGERNNQNATLSTTNINDILACRTALARDLESIDFTLQLSTEHERSKKVLKQITKNDNVKI